MKTQENFTKLHHNLFDIEDLFISEILILNLLMSFQANNKEIFISNKGIVKHFKNKISLDFVKKTIPKLDRLGYISKTRNYTSHKRTVEISDKTLSILKGEAIQPKEEPLVIKEKQEPAQPKPVEQPKPMVQGGPVQNFDYQIEELILDTNASVEEIVVNSIKKAGDLTPYILDGKLQIGIKLGQCYLVNSKGNYGGIIPKMKNGFDQKIFHVINSDIHYIKEFQCQ